MLQLLYADGQGKMFEHGEILAVGRTGGLYTGLEEAEMIPLPAGASLVMIPGGTPVGIGTGGRFTAVSTGPLRKPVYAVGALLPQGYTRTFLPAFRRAPGGSLPLYGYAAVGWKDGKVYTAALRTDEDHKWNPVHYSTHELRQLVADAAARHPDNRIVRQLSRCALEYSCFTAQNLFYRRWEAGIPVSPVCNAGCLGCISLQPAECCPAPQTRIDFKPTAAEISEAALPHLCEAEDAIISFGQGCEGEPSLAASEISEAISLIRQETTKGTINMNTNAGYTEGIKKICAAGIDSLRISTISAIDNTYSAYYSPKGYTWADVCASTAAARSRGVFVALNLLTFPGLTDLPDEVEAMVGFIRAYDVNMVQLRNLNIDPDLLGSKIPLDDPEVLGIGSLVEILQNEIPGLIIGNYSRPVKR